MIARSSGVGLLLVVLTGCGVQRLDWYFCDNPEPDHLGSDGEPDPCHRRDADGGTDAGMDSGTDAGMDSGTDAGMDSGTDAGTDSGAGGGAG
jgi:hypothetical protein